jgi:hypothetical protein
MAPSPKQAVADRDVREAEQEHGERYGLHDNDFEGDDVIAVLKETGRFLALVAGTEAAAGAMRAVLDANCLTDNPLDPDAPWEERLDAVSPLDALEWPLGLLFFRLNAYAYGGVLSKELPTEQERKAALGRMLIQGSALLERIPTNWKLSLSNLRATLSAAQARWALDHNEPLHPDGLAHLGRLAPRTLRNMMSAGQFSPVEGRITPEEARAWLATRESFRPSIWRTQGRLGWNIEEARASDLEKVFFVPVARDGSVFHPGLERNGAFAVGEPEERIAGFHEALVKLQHMRTPKWRRPNTKGNWGLVTGVNWERKSADELSALAARE